MLMKQLDTPDQINCKTTKIAGIFSRDSPDVNNAPGAYNDRGGNINNDMAAYVTSLEVLGTDDRGYGCK